jgi:hypothetical protein
LFFFINISELKKRDLENIISAEFLFLLCLSREIT